MIDAIYEEPERIESKLISEHWGNDIWQNRRARVLFNESSKLFSVELFDAQQKVRTVIREKDLTGTYEIKNISSLLDYQYSRVEKDISMYKSNIEKMKQALEIIALNTSTK